MKDYNEEELKDKTEDTTGEKTEEKAAKELLLYCFWIVYTR